jgi:hypothetical protein
VNPSVNRRAGNRKNMARGSLKARTASIWNNDVEQPGNPATNAAQSSASICVHPSLNSAPNSSVLIREIRVSFLASLLRCSSL